MAESTIEERLANLERQVAELQQKQPAKRPWPPENLPPLTAEQAVMADEIDAYGRYWRKTGKEAPPNWKPGDPIPEMDWDEDS